VTTVGWLRRGFNAAWSFEGIFLLFVTSGIYKATRFFSWAPVDLTLVTGAMTLVAGAVVLARSGGVPRLPALAVAAWGLLFAWSGVSLAWTPGMQVGIARLTVGLPLVLLALAGSGLVIARSEERTRRFLRLFGAFGVLLVLITFASFLWPDPGVQGREGSYIPRGVALAIATVVMIAEAAAPGRSKRVRILAILLALLYGLAVLAAGSRQALAALALTLPVLAHLTWRASARHRALAVGVAASVLIGAGLLVAEFGTELATLRRLEMILSGQFGSSLEVRSVYLATALREFGSAPLLGHGIASFGPIYGVLPTDYPHNLFAEVLFESGLVGFGLLLVAMLLSIGPILSPRATFDPFVRYTVLSAVLIVGFSAMVSGTFTEARLVFGIAGLALLTPTQTRASAVDA
jgi:O-antigen ligase